MSFARTIRSTAVVFGALALMAVPGRAEDPVLIFDPLPQPLRLPPGLVQRLPVHTTASFFGDAIRVVDCPAESDMPLGLCGNQLFGGALMTDSHLAGDLEIRFHPPVNNISHFEIVLGALKGADTVLISPQGYEFPFLDNAVTDVPGRISEGDLDLTTGGVTNLRVNVHFQSAAFQAVTNASPVFSPRPLIAFPGIRGHAWAKFEQRADGLLDFTFRGSTFAPMGLEPNPSSFRFPLPICDAEYRCASVPARGTSFHPHLYLSTKAPEGPECGLNCPEIPENTVREFTVFTRNSSFGDDFHIDIPQLGGQGAGRSHLQGRLQFQFGSRTGDTVSFIVRSMVPEALLAKPPQSILGPGFGPGLLGQEEFLRFPLATYHLKRVVFVDEPFNYPQGTIDLRTGRVIGEMVYPSYYGQSLAEVLFEQNDGRISTDPFFVVAGKPAADPSRLYALFEKGTNGQLVFRYSGEHTRSFATYRFPSPDFRRENNFAAGPGALLDIFLRLQAMHPVDTPGARKNGAAADVLSSVGDRFSYSYSIPCDGAGGTASFEYTNNNAGASGGTFRMTRLASVNCINSRSSTLPAGDYDTVTFSGFGVWSKDPEDSLLRFATVQISSAPDAPYAGILVYQNPDAANNVILSGANTKPVEKPLP